MSILKIIKDKSLDDYHICSRSSNFNLLLVTFINSYSYLILRKNTALLKKFDYVYIDGILLKKLLQIFHISVVERVSFDMESLAPYVFDYAQKNNKKIYLIGTRPIIINSAVNHIKETYPELNIIGHRHGYFKNKGEWKEAIQNIRSLNPDIVVAGMGTDLQEEFLVDLASNGWEGIGFTCGGFLHQTGHRMNYYPEWTNKFNLRWLFRLYKEPGKVGRRIITKYPLFLLFFVLDLIYLIKCNA